MKVQSLGREALVVERFGYAASDGWAATPGELDVFVHGVNDAPIVVKPLANQSLTINKAFYLQVPADSFKDIDQGDALTYTATLADGSSLPDWLHFDAQTLSLSGVSPKADAALDIRVTATDRVAASGSTVGSLAASDVFTLSVSHGNEGVGNGQDAAPAGHTTSTNDGTGTSPGNPGSKTGVSTATSTSQTTVTPAANDSTVVTSTSTDSSAAPTDGATTSTTGSTTKTTTTSAATGSALGSGGSSTTGIDPAVTSVVGAALAQARRAAPTAAESSRSGWRWIWRFRERWPPTTWRVGETTWPVPTGRC